MKKLFILSVIFNFMPQLMAQSLTDFFPKGTSENNNFITSSSWLKKLRKSPASLTFFNEIGTKGSKTSGINSYYNEMGLYFTYKFNKRNALRLNSAFVLSDVFRDTLNSSDHVKWKGATLRYKRSKILTEKKNGIGLSLELRFKIHGEYFDIKKDRTMGSTSLRANFSRKIFSKFLMFGQLRYDEYFRNSSKAKLKRRKIAFLLAPYYYFSSKLFFSPTATLENFVYGDSKKRPKLKNRVKFAPLLGYNFNKDVSITSYWESYPFKSHDNQLMAANWVKKSILATFLTYKFF